MLTLSLNNESHTLPEPMSLSQALDHWGMCNQMAAAAINGEFVPRSQYSEVTLHEGDKLDIVKPVGGG
ncbi:sulfur carrier protein ThiS [Pseudomaricurvus sp.]|uniref:sulfur carrier protein ThiS n=1 Tax=Pseudomaricurvus sp. TaxID=2004510 RepID=UPI003F6CE427